jgi:hypothetical protein
MAYRLWRLTKHGFQCGGISKCQAGHIDACISVVSRDSCTNCRHASERRNATTTQMGSHGNHFSGQVEIPKALAAL